MTRLTSRRKTARTASLEAAQVQPFVQGDSDGAHGLFDAILQGVVWKFAKDFQEGMCPRLVLRFARGSRFSTPHQKLVWTSRMVKVPVGEVWQAVAYFYRGGPPGT